MDVVLVGLPGSGKTTVGRALAARHGTAFVDLDIEIEREAGRSVAEIFETEGEAGFRRRERRAVEALGAADRAPGVGRVVAAGGGAVADPRNRWRLYDGRFAAWLDAPTDELARRLAGDPAARPLVVGGDPVATLARLRAERLPFYAAATAVRAAAAPADVVAAIDGLLPDRPTAAVTVLRQATAASGQLVLGARNAARELPAELRAAGAGRVVIVSEPGAWAAAGAAIADGLTTGGWLVEPVLLPRAEDAKRLAAVEAAAGRLAELGVEREEPIVAIGGGALTDAAGFVAATYARGIPWIAVPTTLVGQIDAALGGKTAVDLPAGKNLVGAFHPPLAVVADVAVLASLPERDRRAALAEAIKVGILGEPMLLDLLEASGPALAAGGAGAAGGEAAAGAVSDGSLVELVERSARYKLAVVDRDPTERGERVALNLGHSLGHAIEAATGFGPVRHGEAVAYGLRAATQLAVRRGRLGSARAGRVDSILDALGLGVEPLPCPAGDVLAALATDKKRRGGRLRWVLPTDDGWTVDDRVPDVLVREVVAGVLGGRLAGAATR